MLGKLLITGAAGGLGGLIRDRLGLVARSVRLSDIVASEGLDPDADFVPCDLADASAVNRLVAGCDGIVHLGGISTEKSFARILPANIIGVHNLYEAARRNGLPRILFASSNHVVGYYRQTDRLDADAAHRPDGWYGISKSFGEAVALMYFEKFGQESALVRIGSCLAEPKDYRMLATWLSPEDFIALIARVFAVDKLGCPVIYGASANTRSWWDNGKSAYLGWEPKHDSEDHAHRIERTVPKPDRNAAVALYQGGVFTDEPIHED